MKKIILKSLYVLAAIKYPHIQKDYRYFIRDNYYCRLFQNKFFFQDYTIKKKYKCIEYFGEFQQELTFILPFAYWHYLNGTLQKTVSCKNTKELYFFSSNHEEKYTERDWTSNYSSFEVPNMTHSISFSFSKWVPVPFKQFYKNELFVFSKPILVIANKYNIEWDGPPLNYFDISALDKIINKFKDKYQIIYNRPLSSQIVSDNSDILDLNEYAWLRNNHSEVVLMNDLYFHFREQVNNFNHLQLMVYANCNHFISVHGGTATLASCFGGTNIILSKRGIEHDMNEYDTLFPALSKAKILHAKKVEDVFSFLDMHY